MILNSMPLGLKSCYLHEFKNFILIFRNHKEWTLVSSSVKAGGNFVVLDLNPATWYNLKVTAHNNAGFSVAEYEFVGGGIINPKI